jgi:putative autoinducer-2 (AI-2) aldolase
MPEVDKEGEKYQIDQPQTAPGFYLKGSHHLDWGMKNRLARVFDPATGRTVMLAIDHGYFQGPTTGLERIDLSIVPLLPSCDALVLYAWNSALVDSGSVYKAKGTARQRRTKHSPGRTIRRTDRHGHGGCSAPQRRRRRNPGVHWRRIRNAFHPQHDQARGCRTALRHPSHGRHRCWQEHGARRQVLACRIIAELGAQYVKTYYVDEGFETVTASCPVPIVMAGGKKLPEIEALTMAYNAVQQGAAGVDMGRNIFQSDAPKAMIAAVHAVVHRNLKPTEAFELFKSLKAKG